jgi:hypothetical protein
MEMALPQYRAEMERPLGLLPSTGPARARSPPPLLRLSESASVTDRVREASGANPVGRTFSFLRPLRRAVRPPVDGQWKGQKHGLAGP